MRRGGELRALTSLRFFAAFAVFMHHTTEQWKLWDRTASMVPAFFEGFSGVTFFFILSGFILSYNYWNRLTLSGRDGVWTFWTARVARILPVHLLTFVAAWVVLLPELKPWELSQVQVVSAITTLSLTHAFIPSMAMYFSFNTVAWSLSTEMFFYAMFPAVILLLDRVRHRLTAWKLVTAAVWIWGIGYLFTQGLVSVVPADLIHWQFYINPVWRFGDFLIGVLLGIAFLQLRSWHAVREEHGRVPAWQRTRSFRLGRVAALTAVEVAAVWLLVRLVLDSAPVNIGLRFDSYYVAPMALSVVAFAFEGGLVSRLVAIRPLRLLGEASFSFYMFHAIVIHEVMTNEYFRNHPIRGVGVSFLVTLVLSMWSLFLFEGPSRRFIRRRAEAMRTRNDTLRPGAPSAERVPVA